MRSICIATCVFAFSHLLLCGSAIGRVIYEVGNGNIEVVLKDGDTKKTVKTCKLRNRAEDATLSSDGLALIVSSTEYVLTRELDACTGEHSIQAYKIPEKAGTLVDINLTRKIYVALDFVSTQPLLYAATVAKIGSTRNLVTLPGAYVQSWPLKKLQRHGFQEGPEYRLPRISLDGRYVAVSGEVRCDEDAFPGVWEVERNRKVVLGRKKYSEAERDAECKRLFGY